MSFSYSSSNWPSKLSNPQGSQRLMGTDTQWTRAHHQGQLKAEQSHPAAYFPTSHTCLGAAQVA